MPMHAFLTACIILSQTISKKQKIRFLLGVFDEDDSLTIEEEEFSAHLQALFAGLSAIFCIKGARPRARIEPLAKQMFSRMSDHTAENSTSLPFSLNEELEELKVSYVQSQQRLKQFDQYLAAPKLPSRIRQELVAGWQDHLSSTLRTDVEDDGAKEADSKGVMELEKEEYVARS
eukprot:g19695.t1